MSSNTRPTSIVVDSGLAAAPGTASENLVGMKVGGFRVVRLLGTGGMGAVYEGQNDHGSRVAIKVLHSDVAADPALRAQFERETKIVSKLDNVHIVRGFGYEVLPDGRPCLLMMFHENTSLDAVMAANHGRLSVRDALAYGYQILGGLKAAHGAMVFHRDLKPSNALVLNERLQVDGVNVPLVKLVDFGLAFDASARSKRLSKPLHGVGEAEQVRAGTPAYLSPEHALDQPTDARSDLYAFGVMLFEMLSGELPFDGSDVAMMQKHISEIAPRVSTRTNGLPEGVDDLVARLLEKNPADRPQSAEETQREVLKLLRKVQGDQTSVGRPIPFDTARLPNPNAGPKETLVLPRNAPVQPLKTNWAPVYAALVLIAIGAAVWALWPAPQVAQPIELVPVQRKPEVVQVVTPPVPPVEKVEPKVEVAPVAAPQTPVAKGEVPKTVARPVEAVTPAQPAKPIAAAPGEFSKADLLYYRGLISSFPQTETGKTAEGAKWVAQLSAALENRDVQEAKRVVSLMVPE